MELQLIQNKIYKIRSQKVMLDFDLAELYEVQTKNLNLAVKRNLKRFPKDFLFQLTKPEWENLRLQIETSKGVMSNILWRLKVLRTFQCQCPDFQSCVAHWNVKITRNLTIDMTLEGKYDKQFKGVYEALDYLIKKDMHEIEKKERKRIGFKSNT